MAMLLMLERIFFEWPEWGFQNVGELIVSHFFFIFHEVPKWQY